MAYTANLSKAAFLENEKTFDAVVRNLEVIGETRKRLPVPFVSLRLRRPAMALTYRFIMKRPRTKQPQAVFLTRLLACSTVKPMTSSPS